jgi:hypothetical protein
LLGHIDAAALEILPQPFDQVFLKLHLLTQYPGDGLTCQIVLGWAQPTGAQDDLGAVESPGEGLAQMVQIIPYLVRLSHLKSQSCQLGRQVGRIGIGYLSHQQFVSDREDLGLHDAPSKIA